MAAQPDRTLEQNRDAWNAGRYDAWVEGIGAPAIEAARLVADPRHKLRRLLPHLGEVAGKRVCNVQGSHGRVAVALALLGADATVIDFAEENRRYALELAAAADVTIDYRLADVMQADQLGLEPFDMLVMELGITHYHQDIAGFFRTMAAVTRPGGQLLLEEFHPVERKLFRPGGGALGDYFRTELVVGDVPDPTGAGRSLGQCVMRGWTLGEIVTAVIDAGFTLRRLEEHPSWTDATVPGTFILVGRR
ncbi:MAG TPA: methyltransferase domain-containing protein [Caulobacteraceae bacterium]|nr:methyltransferase domain-containing protein [Caulobacteraceae bacterium]